jgi:hypothetical protein
MITRRYREPRGLNSDREEYGFFVRVSGEDRELLKTAVEVAKKRLGGHPSNPMLLLDMMSVYTGRPIVTSARDTDDELFI